LNELQKSITEICCIHKLKEKILIVPSFSQGHQITESLVKNGISYINLRIKTLTSLAHEIIDLDLAKTSIKYLSETSTRIIIEDLFSEIREKEDSYFHQIEPKEGIADALEEAIRELRMSGINADSLTPKHFVNEKKGTEIIELFKNYELYLQENHYADKPEILRRAIEKLKDNKDTPDNRLYLFLSDVPYSPLEKLFIESLPGEKIVLPHNGVHGIAYPQRLLQPTINKESTEITSNREKLPYLFEPEKAPEVFKDSTIEIFHAVGRRNEIREVVRRIISSGKKNDEVEVIHTSYDDYVPMIYDLSCKFSIPMTFEEGLPITFTRPGRAALGFLSWISSNYQAIKLRQLIASGNVDLKTKGEDELISPAVMARILRESPIGWGKNRYVDILNRMVEHYKSNALILNENNYNNKEFYQQKEANTRFLLTVLRPILDSIPTGDENKKIALKDLCICVRDFIAQYARVSNELDGEAKAVITERLNEIQTMTTKTMSFPDALNQIELTLRDIKVGQSYPAPGCLHISSYLNGGRSGRRHAYIIGCDAQTFPGTVIQNPVLLDEEIEKISNNLLTSSEFLKEKLYRAASLLSSLRGNITLSFSSFDVIENRESFPSSILLQVYRLLSGNPHASYTDFMKDIGLPSGYIPPGVHLDMSDYWITSFIGEHGLRRPDTSVFQCYPGLAQGKKAEDTRETDTVTEFDGKLLSPGKELDPRENAGLVMSASMLERLAKCPYAYFLYHVLRVRPLEEITLTEDTWLDEMQRGSLLHKLFERFMKEITAKKENPSVAKHTTLIKSLLEGNIQEFREKIPPPSEAIFAQESKILHKASDIFLKTEEIRCERYSPAFFEFAFGSKDADPDLREPVKIPLGTGKSFNLAGRIDRIDKITEHECAVIDYKTGSAYNYKNNVYFNKGKNIQHAVYAIAAETLLRKIEKDEKLVVTSSGYLFPTEKETGRLLIYGRNDTQLTQLLELLFDIIRTGIFIPSNEKDSCTYCDYTDICGESVKERTRLKFENTDNSEIVILKKLEDYA
jgi:ATP-dependent helicase/DNAse subunit B